MFKSARLKLTAWYLVIIMAVSISFSGVVYNILTREFDRFGRFQRFRIEHGYYPEPYGPLSRSKITPEPDMRLIREVHTRLLWFLLYINSGVLVLSALLGYFLAGKTLRPIQTMVDEQNRFISDASHEFRTPLAALKSSLEVFLRDPQSNVEGARILVKDCIEDVDGLTALSDSLLKLASYQKPNQKLPMEEISLNGSVEEAVKKMRPIIEQKGASVKINPTSVNYKILGNKQSLVDLFVILLDNSLKYSKENCAVDIETKRVDGVVRATVRDNGLGISQKDLPHIFDRFYRVDISRGKEKSLGYGLGLSIANNIVKAQKGSIRVQSELNKGTTMILEFPSANSVPNSAIIQEGKVD